jgi:hypothetical protein
MAISDRILLGGAAGEPVTQLASMSNRHGLIAGVTGTGKTVSLQILAEGFSRLGVPVFAADIKGDLSGLAVAASPHPKIQERVDEIPVPDYRAEASPVLFWDLFGESGHPVRTTISEMGPLLLASLLELNETQEGVLYVAFRVADEQGLLLLDLKDLRALLNWLGENRAEFSQQYGNLALATIASIQRQLLVLEEQGGDKFFGEPALRLSDLMQRDFTGRGVISLLDATRLYDEAPRLYSAFLLWLLAELYEELPEAGDAPLPRLVFFFDEAHLLFENAPRALQEKIEQVVRMIRSKGVGVYFVTQSPTDVPDDVLGQLGLKLQHALRAFTPKDHKAIRAAADNFPDNPGLDVIEVLTDLGIGEALVSSLDEKGRPQPVQRTLIVPPRSRIGPLSPEERREVLGRSPLAGRYDTAQDRDSAYEELTRRAQQRQEQVAADARAAAEAAERTHQSRSSGNRRQSVGEALVKSAARSIGSQLGRQIMRGMLGALLGRR